MTPVFEQGMGHIQRALAGSRLTARMALKLRNQCDMILGARLSWGNLLDDSGEVWLIDRIAPVAGYFVDVGANIGQWTLAFGGRMQARPRGLLFEPNPQTTSLLSANLEAAGFDGCEVVEAAASDATGSATFLAEEWHGETSSFYSANLKHRAATAVEVTLLRLDQELSRRNIAFVDMLKIDAEGHDFAVLHGAEAYLKEHKIGVLQFEYNLPWRQAGATLLRAYEFLRDLRYEVRLLGPSGLFEVDVRQLGEYYQYSNFVGFCPSDAGDVLAKLPSPSLV